MGGDRGHQRGGALVWAGLFAVADQGRVAAGQSTLDSRTQTLPLLYSAPITLFHDITTGNNGYAAGQAEGIEPTDRHRTEACGNKTRDQDHVLNCLPALVPVRLNSLLAPLRL